MFEAGQPVLVAWRLACSLAKLASTTAIFCLRVGVL